MDSFTGKIPGDAVSVKMVSNTVIRINEVFNIKLKFVSSGWKIEMQDNDCCLVINLDREYITLKHSATET